MYHPTALHILNLLKQHNFWYETFEHEPVITSVDAAKLRHGYTISQGAKALIAKVDFKDKKGEYVMFVLPGDARLDSKKIKANLDIKSFRFATEEELTELTNGVVRGGVPPFGNLFNLQVYVDKKLLENNKIIFNAGDRSFSIAMLSEDYVKLVKSNIVEII